MSDMSNVSGLSDMSEFALTTACGGDAATLASECAAKLQQHKDHTVGFIYVTSPLAADLERTLEILKSQSPVQHWVGTVGHGICATATEYFNQPAMVALTCKFGADEFRIVDSIRKPGDAISSIGGERSAAAPGVAAAPPGFAAAMAIIHADPRNGLVSELIASFAAASGAFLVGGLSSGDDAFPQIADTITDGGISGILIGGRRQIAIGLTQGCSPIGPAHDITEVDGNVLLTLDNRPALEVLYADAGLQPGDDPRAALANIHAALLIGSAEKGDYLVRHLIGIDPAKGLVAIADDATETSRVVFVRRDAANAAIDIERMLDDLQSRISTPPKAGLYYSCVARGPQLFGHGSFETAYEMQAIKKRFGDIPIAGFFGNGEISNDRVYAYTGVLTLFH